MKQFNTKNIFSSLLVKFAICSLLLAISYRLLSSSFVQFSLVVSDGEAAALAATTPPSPPPITDDLLLNLDYTSRNGE